jgi:hypothetical protein
MNLQKKNIFIIYSCLSCNHFTDFFIKSLHLNLKEHAGDIIVLQSSVYIYAYPEFVICFFI